MDVVFKNMKDMLIPFFAFPNQYLGSVYVVTIGDDGKWHRIIENSHKKRATKNHR